MNESLTEAAQALGTAAEAARDKIAALEAALAEAQQQLADSTATTARLETTLRSQEEKSAAARKIFEQRAKQQQDHASDMAKAALEQETKIARLEATIRVAKAENKGLWKLVERYHATWDKDTAVQNRAKFEHERLAQQTLE